MMIDTHCHLQAHEFDEDRDKVIERARGADVRVMMAVGADIDSSKAAIGLAEREQGVHAAVGVHPNHLSDAPEDWAEQILKLARDPCVKAIGESGMDLYRDRTDPEVQRAGLRRHLEIAREVNLPIILHSRAAGKDVLDIVEEFGKDGRVRGVMHCFTEPEPIMRRAVDLGLHISFAGPLTYPISRKTRELLKRVPDSRVLVETDSPYLGAEPVKHRRNEPAYLRYVMTKVAEMRRISPRDASRITTVNADNLFGLKVADRTPRIAYGIRSALYLNITNRCTGRCTFCPRTRGEERSADGWSHFVKGHNLRLETEPSAEDVIAAMGEISPYREIVFCGLGEPTIRLEVLLEVARWVRAQGQRVRLDTNGHGNLYHGRSIVPDLAEAVDAVWISLNAATSEEYVKLCRPEGGAAAFDAVIAFIRECREHIPDVVITAVEVPGLAVPGIRKFAHDLGIRYHARRPDEVG